MPQSNENRILNPVKIIKIHANIMLIKTSMNHFIILSNHLNDILGFLFQLTSNLGYIITNCIRMGDGKHKKITEEDIQ